MAESEPTTIETVATDEQPEVSQNFVQKLANKHPRTARVVTYTGAVLSVVGVACVARTVRGRRDHLSAAKEHASEAVSELTATLDPASPEA